MATQQKSKIGQEALGKIMGVETSAAPPVPPPPPPAPPAEQSQSQGESSSPPRRKNPRLDHWSVLLAEADPGTLGPDFKYRLRGEIHGHPNPKFSDGEIVVSSPLFSLDVTGKTARTKNTVYELGDPDPAFVEYVQKLGKKLEDYNFAFEENARKNPRRL